METSTDDINLILADDEGRLVVADVAVKSFEFWVVTVYASNIAVERVPPFQHLVLFLDDSKQIFLM